MPTMERRYIKVTMAEASTRCRLIATNIEPARALAVTMPLDTQGKIDDFIDDLPGVGPDFKGVKQKLSSSILLAMETMMRFHKNSPLPRDPLVSLKKLAAEMAPSETKTILGLSPYRSRRRSLQHGPTKRRRSSGQRGHLSKSSTL